MQITVNGDVTDVSPGTSLAGLLARELPGGTLGAAIALNGAVVPRSDHAETRLADGDRVEIVTAVQGG